MAHEWAWAEGLVEGPAVPEPWRADPWFQTIHTDCSVVQGPRRVCLCSPFPRKSAFVDAHRRMMNAEGRLSAVDALWTASDCLQIFRIDRCCLQTSWSELMPYACLVAKENLSNIDAVARTYGWSELTSKGRKSKHPGSVQHCVFHGPSCCTRVS